MSKDHESFGLMEQDSTNSPSQVEALNKNPSSQEEALVKEKFLSLFCHEQTNVVR